MYITVSDRQAISAVEGQAFSMIQQSLVSAQATFTNVGDNTINYRAQQLIAGSWHDLASLGDPLNTTLSPAQTRLLEIVSTYPQVRVLANATGGSSLDFAIQRFATRTAGGVIPLLNY